MKLLRIRSFRSRLLALTTATASLSVLLVCAAGLTLQTVQTHARAVDAARTQARVFAQNVAAAVAFSDPVAVDETMAGLAAVEEAQGVELRDASGALLRGVAETDEAAAALARPGDGEGLLARVAVVTEPVVFEGEAIGSLRVAYSLASIHRLIAQQALAYLGIGVVAWLLSLVLAHRLQKNLVRPVQELGRVAEGITRDQDYGLRAERFGDDELGALTERFNGMLGRVEAADRALQESKGQLEQRVGERTAELAEALHDAEAASRAKSDFLANMSHEIRTPMTAILGYSEMLLDRHQSDEERLDCVQTVHRNGKHLLSIINDILDISKIEAGAMTVEAVETDLVQLIADVASLTRIRALEKGIGFQVRFECPVPSAILSDPTRLRQVLINLVGNAIKFTESGGVCLRLFRGGGGTLCFQVRDSGIGMSALQRDNLFQAFQQADETMTRRFGGTGLGLAISKQLALLLGGDIEVESAEGIGSSFCVRIPEAAAPGSTELAQVSESEVFEKAGELPGESLRKAAEGGDDAETLPAAGVRVLLCEDGEDNRRFIGRFLKRIGAEVTMAENGLLGKDAALEADASGNPFDLVLMDMQMPVMDGYTACRKLRIHGYTGQITALTAHAMTEDRARCLDAGCDDYLTKPIDHAKLTAAVAAFAPAKGTPAEGTSAASTRAENGPPPAGEPEVSSGGRGSAAEAPPADVPSADVPSAGALHSRFAGDPFFAELVAEFVEVLPARAASLEAAVAAGDAGGLARLLHQLKGSAGTHGFDEISEEAKALEARLAELNGDPLPADAARVLVSLTERATAAPGPADANADARKAA